MLFFIRCFEESKFTYLSNTCINLWYSFSVLKNQNLHISQTGNGITKLEIEFWRIKIYISLKQQIFDKIHSICFEESKFTYLSNLCLQSIIALLVLKNQNLHISQTSNLRFRVEILNLGIKKWIDTDPARRQFR